MENITKDELIIYMSKSELKSLIREVIEESIKIEVVPVEDKSDELLKIDEVSKLFGVSKQTIHNWKKLGKIPSHRISSRIYYKKKEILNFLNKVN